jgi:hypothetical protein
MPAPWVALDVIPELARPDPVAEAVAEAVELRDRLRVAKQELAEAEGELERLEQDDVAAAAEKIRAGATPGSIPAAISKARQAVELKTRDARALAVASEAAQADLVGAMTASAGEWVERIEDATGEARERATAALAALTEALDQIATSTSASAWIQVARDDARWDRPPRLMHAGTVAPTSARRTANSEALRVDEVLGYARELIDPPAPPARVVLGEPDASAA